MIPTRKLLAGTIPLMLLFGLLVLFAPTAVLSQNQGKDDKQKQEPAKKGEPKKDPGKKGQQKQQPESTQVTLPDDWVKQLKWRSIGPANMGGRITAISVYEADPCIYYAATASGGLLKTINNGITFQHQFDREATVSIGDVCVAQTDPNIVWVGTGEHNPRNSVSYGDGVYKSIDGGKTWKNMGLKKSYQIGKILVHPKNPDIVYVGAMGRCYGPNPERGLFKTTDGGKTWKKILYADENTGVIDMRMHPEEPDTLIVAMWERQRDGFDSFLGQNKPKDVDTYDPAVKWGPKAGLYKTTDGGETFRKLSEGLPTCKFGRIGLDYYRKNPDVIFAVVDCEKIGMGTPPKAVAYIGANGEDKKGGAALTTVTPNGPAAKSGLKVGDLVILMGESTIKGFQDFVDKIQKKSPGDKINITVLRDDEKKKLTVTLGKRPTQTGRPGGGFGGPGGTKKDRPYHALYGGQRENVQDKQGPNSHEYGGVYRSADGGETWKRINSLNPRPMYFSEIRVDPSDEKYVYVLGVGLNGSKDGGKTFSSRVTRGIHSDQHALWINPKDGRHMVIGTDGGHYVTYDRMKNWDHLNHMAMGQFYHVAVCSKKPYYVYGGLQDNGTWGGPSMGLKGIGPINEDWISVGGGDGFQCQVDPNDPDLVYFESQNGAFRRRNLRTGQTASLRPAQEKGMPRYRFNWNSPFILSRQNSKIYYCAGNYVFRSLNQGAKLRKISPEITHTNRGSATTLSESPKNPDVLWVGTDDGAIWVTRNAGEDWTNVSAKVPLPGPRWVATIETSRFVEGRAYVCFDAHRSDDDNPYVFATEDFGATWKSIRGNLPVGSSRCLREDIKNPNLLYCGTEFAVYASIDRGESWRRINNNLPTVAVHEIAVHPTAGEIVAATHGRSLWILDVSALRQVTKDTLAKGAHLYAPKTVVRWQSKPRRGGTNRRYVGTNPVSGTQICYSITKPAEKVSLSIHDINGKVIRALQAKTNKGLHVVRWDLRTTPQRQAGARGGRGGFAGRGRPGGVGGAARGGGGRGGAGRGGRGGSLVDRFNGFDKNNDGKISKKDVPEGLFSRMFDNIDSNSDGVVDQKELKQFATKSGARGGTARGGTGRGGTGRGGTGRGGFVERLKEFDENKDGKISKKEVAEPFDRIFDRVDSNSDGFIDQKELQQYASRFSGRGGRGGRGGPSAAYGIYRIVLTVDGEEISQIIRIEADPNAPADSIFADDDEDQFEEEEEEREGAALELPPLIGG